MHNTTNAPQKHHSKTPSFLKTPSKTPQTHPQKDIAKYNDKKPVSRRPKPN
jgi:hypothetical protein